MSGANEPHPTAPRWQGCHSRAHRQGGAVVRAVHVSRPEVPRHRRDLASCEVHGVSTIAASGVAYEQNFVMVVEARDGRIVRYREYWSPIVAMALVKPT